MGEDRALFVFNEALIVLSPQARADKGFARSHEDLSPAEQGVLAEAILRRLRDPSLVSPPDAVAKEVRFGAEDLIEVEGDGHFALGGSEWRSESGGGGGGGGRITDEVEVGEEAVGPFASGAGDSAGDGGGGGGVKLLEGSMGEKWGDAKSGEANAQLSQGFHYSTA